MNRIATLIFVLFSFCAVAQHKVAVSANSDFKTINNGSVKSTFIFNEDLTPQQIEEFSSWAAANKEVGTFELVGKNLTTSLTVNGNSSQVYSKMFYLLGVDALEVVVNGQKKTFDRESFFQHFNL